MLTRPRQSRVLLTILVLATACAAESGDDVGASSEWLTVELDPATHGFDMDPFWEALREANGDGLVLRVPAGRYSLGNATFDPDCTDMYCDWTSLDRDLRIECEPGAILDRNGSSAVAIFNFNAMENVSVEGCTFEFTYASGTPAVPSNFNIGISFDEGDGLNVTRNTFRVTNEPAYGNTQHAILARGATNIVATQNMIEFMQFKLGGPSNTDIQENILVSENVFESPYNFAVSVVGVNGTEVIRNVQIVDNVVHNVPSGGAFFVGQDGESAEIAELSNLVIANNVISGRWNYSNPGIGITVRAGDVSHDWTIANNIVVNENVSGGSYHVYASRGILLYADGEEVERVSVVGNTVGGLDQPNSYLGGFDHACLTVTLRGADFLISNNTLTHCRRLEILTDGAINRLLVTDNLISARRYAVSITSSSSATGSGFYRSSVLGNLLEVAAYSGNYAVYRDLAASESYEIVFQGNTLLAESPAGAWGGDNPSDEYCLNNVLQDGSGTAASNCP